MATLWALLLGTALVGANLIPDKWSVNFLSWEMWGYPKVYLETESNVSWKETLIEKILRSKPASNLGLWAGASGVWFDVHALCFDVIFLSILVAANWWAVLGLAALRRKQFSLRLLMYGSLVIAFLLGLRPLSGGEILLCLLALGVAIAGLWSAHRAWLAYRQQANERTWLPGLFGACVCFAVVLGLGIALRSGVRFSLGETLWYLTAEPAKFHTIKLLWTWPFYVSWPILAGMILAAFAVLRCLWLVVTATRRWRRVFLLKFGH